MGLVKDIFGVGCSATITGVMFLGAPLIGIVYSLLPGDMVDVLATPDRPVVYFDGAYELSEVEVDGELEGVSDHDVIDPEEPTEQDEDEQEGVDDDAEGEIDPDQKEGQVGGEVDAKPVLNNESGTRARPNRGGALKRPPRGIKVTEGPKKKKSRRKCAESYDGISKRRDGTYVISKELVNYYTASIKHFNELGWSRANERGDGKGWYISGFGCNDPLFHGGLRRGDIILTVNGKKTNNMMQVFLLYGRVKTKKHFVVKVRRRGKELTLQYDIIRG